MGSELLKYQERVTQILQERREALGELQTQILNLNGKLDVASQKRAGAFGRAQELLSLSSVERAIRLELSELKKKAQAAQAEVERAEQRLVEVNAELESGKGRES